MNKAVVVLVTCLLLGFGSLSVLLCGLGIWLLLSPAPEENPAFATIQPPAQQPVAAKVEDKGPEARLEGDRGWFPPYHPRSEEEKVVRDRRDYYRPPRPVQYKVNFRKKDPPDRITTYPVGAHLSVKNGPSRCSAAWIR
jgi:hypothetical protein